MRSLFALLAAFLLVPAAGAQTETLAGKTTVSLSVGYAAYGMEGFACDPAAQTDFGTNACVRRGTAALDPTRRQRGEGGGIQAAVRFRSPVSGQFAGELAVNSHLITAGENLPIKGLLGGNGVAWTAGLDLGGEYAFSTGDLRPLASAGVGLLMVGRSGTTGFNETGVSPAAYLGVGVDKALADGWFARADARLRHVWNGGETLARGAEITIGAGYGF